MAPLRSFEVSRRIDVSIDLDRSAWPAPEVKARGLFFCPGRWSITHRRWVDQCLGEAIASKMNELCSFSSQGAKIQNTGSCGDKRTGEKLNFSVRQLQSVPSLERCMANSHRRLSSSPRRKEQHRHCQCWSYSPRTSGSRLDWETVCMTRASFRF